MLGEHKYEKMHILGTNPSVNGCRGIYTLKKGGVERKNGTISINRMGEFTPV